MSEKKLKKRPAGVNDKIDVTYTSFATNKEKTQMLTGEGRNFDNDELLKMLGFREDEKGGLSLKATSHSAERDSKGNITKRTSKSGITLTERETGVDR